MEVTKISSKIQLADKIYHISDVHIRTLKRHQEYRHVFENMFNYINQTKTENSIAVVTGDIVHSKLDMSPELIRMLTDFFRGFNIPTIVILGNHDMNLNNLYREDALSPVLDMIKNDNIVFIKDNGVFDFAGITWNHMAVDVEPAQYINGNDIKTDNMKIALHHGAVHNAKTDIGYEISNEHVTTELFSGHDMTLLGDIHKPAQFLNSEKTIAYPGSLIQQNHGEALDHGILIWDVKTRKAEFVEIHNDYGYVTIETNGPNIIKSPHRMPNKPRIRIKFNETSAADMKKLVTTIRKKYNVQDITIQRTISANHETDTNSIAIGNVRDVEYQNTLLTDFINVKFPTATPNELDAIRHINRSINSKLPAVESLRHITWHPVSFEFENMFSYGDGNRVDFNKMSDVCGLFASNTSGKSSLLDAITYTIFDKCSKTSKAHEVLNNKQSSFKGIFKFKMNDVLYTIERTGTKKKDTHVKVDVNFYTETENLNGDERSDTNKSIRRYIGTYNDFILTAFSLQADNNNFIEKSQRERKDLLSQFLDITVFEQLYQLATDEIKETNGRLKAFKKTDFAETITSTDTIIKDNSKLIKDINKNESTNQDLRNKLQEDILQLIESKQPTSYEGDDISILQETESDLIDKIETLQTTIDETEQIITNYQDKIDIISKTVTIQNYNVPDLEDKVRQLVDTEFQLDDLKEDLQKQQRIVNDKQTKIEHLETHEYDPNCKYCVSNVFVQDAIQAKDEINQDRKILDDIQNNINLTEIEVAKLTVYKQSLEQYNESIDNINTHTNKIELLELQLQIHENDLQTKESELENNIERQDLFKRNETAIQHNIKIDNEITICKSKINTVTIEIKKLQDQIKINHGEIEVAKTQRKTALEQLEIYQQLETEYKAYEYYLKSVNRDGIPYDLISKAIPKIETEINNVLNQVVDFNMVMNTDGKNINGYIIYDEDNYWPLELTSGMERFISSLAIRIALINVSALPRPNFIAIDEGWGSLDADHIASVTNLFDYFRTKFDFSIIISHVDTMRDMVDNLIEVNKINGYSQILHI
jgi:DNA repair exonuclease SbcCD ATPase subunit